MTIYRRNPLLMTVMGANPGRSARRRDDPVDKAIGEAWHRLMSGVQVSVMDIPRIFRDVKLEVAGGMSVEEAVMRVGARFQVNRNPSHRALGMPSGRQCCGRPELVSAGQGVECLNCRRWEGYDSKVRRNPSLAASLAGGVAGAFVTQALSNPRGPSFVVIGQSAKTGRGEVVYTAKASGTGDAARNKACLEAQRRASATGTPHLVYFDMHGLKRGMEVNVDILRLHGVETFYPDPHDTSRFRRNPLTEAEHRQIVGVARHDRGVAEEYSRIGRPNMAAQYHGRAARGLEIAHNFSPRSNPGRRVVARWEAKGGKRWIELYQDSHGYGYDSDNGGGYLGNLGSDENAIARMEHLSYGSAASLKADFPSTRRTLNPQSNPGPKGRRKITMTVQQFATWVKKKRDPAMWRAFLAKFRGYEKWTHGAKSRKVTLEWQNVPGMDGLWITYDGGKQPESTYIMRKGSPRKGAWKHEWETMPDIKHDPEAGLVLNKLRGKSKITDFYHK